MFLTEPRRQRSGLRVADQCARLASAAGRRHGHRTCALRRLVVAPNVLQHTAIDPDDVADRLSAAYLITVNARTVSEVGAITANTATGTHLATLTIDTVIGFRSPEDRATFATDLQSAVTALIARYHHNDGRPHRLTVSSYPRPQEPS